MFRAYLRRILGGGIIAVRDESHMVQCTRTEVLES